MKWEIKDNTSHIGDIRFRTRFAWLPTRVLSKITHTDHMIWLQLYVEEQVYARRYDSWEGIVEYWRTVSKTIHI
jgi:hypothetical protein